MSGEKGDHTLFPEEGSIEHIIPQQCDDRALNVGNLIALEGDINRECDKLDYLDKIQHYKKSKYQCVKKFVDNHASWDMAQIDNRAKKMANQIFYDFLRKETKL